MKMSSAMNYIYTSAWGISSLLSDNSLREEYILLALLKFATLDQKEYPYFASEIQIIKRKLNTDIQKAIQELEQKLQQSNIAKLPICTQLINDANSFAKNSLSSELCSYHVLDMLMKRRPDLFKKDMSAIANALKNIAKTPTVQPEKPKVVIPDPIVYEEEVKDNEEPTNLQTLLKTIRSMNEILTSNIKGQDHAIRSFIEGYFNAEVLDSSRQARKRPKATFLFAGPPGVGKTFLAELASECSGLQYRRFDMSSYSDHHSGEQLIGQTDYYSRSKGGLLTQFVKNNPKSIILFDEIEKAHTNVIYLFLQLLDAGTLEDQKTNEVVSFKDTILIFTTNAGRGLYEGKEDSNLSLLTSKEIMNGIKEDVNPLTNEPYFPGAICSRLASGTVLMFNHLQPHHLQDICASEINKNITKIKELYKIQLTYDNKLPSLLLYREGGIADARTLRAKTELFIKNEFMKCIELFHVDHIDDFEKTITKIHISVEDFESIKELQKEVTNEILVYGNDLLGQNLKLKMKNYSWNITSNIDEVFDLFSKKDIQFVLLDLGNKPTRKSSTFEYFDYMPLSASIFKNIREFLELMCERLPDIPIYLLDRKLFALDDQIKMQFSKLGVRQVFSISKENDYINIIENSMKHSQLNLIATSMKMNHKMIEFQTAPILNPDHQSLTIRCRDFVVEDLIDIEDAKVLVSDAERPTIKFTDVIGAKSAKEELQFFIKYLKNPKKYMAEGLKPPKGVLLYGPPGTGKTMLAKAMAGESDVSFISVSASNFVGKWVGEGQKAVRDLFSRARKNAPCIVFIDEIDAIGKTRTGDSTNSAEESTLNTLLTEMDGFKVDLRKPVFILAATNFKVSETTGGIGYIDPALVRRFDRKIHIDLPTKDERYELLKLLCSRIADSKITNEALKNIASRSVGLSSSVLTNVVNQANRDAQKLNIPLTDELLTNAFETTVHGEVKDWGYDFLERFAWHEAGHAYMYYKMGRVPSYLTIVSRGNHGGYMQLDNETSPLQTKEQLLMNVRVALAGRASEIVHYGNINGISTGASDDIKQATQTIYDLICNYGMDETFGMVYINEELMKTPEIAIKIHKRANEILTLEFAKTIKEISLGLPKIEKLALALLNKNSLMGDEILNILK